MNHSFNKYESVRIMDGIVTALYDLQIINCMASYCQDGHIITIYHYHLNRK
jgi:hypothetical protein